MNHPHCVAPIPVSTLLEYWLGELDETREAEVDEHLLGCGHCSASLQSVIDTSEGVRAAVCSGALQTVVTEPFFTHLHTAQMMADITVSPGRAGPISIEIQLRTPEEEVLAAKGVSVTLSSPDIGIEPSTAEAQSLGEGQWRVSMAAPVAGRWTVRLDILISDFDQLHGEAPILID